MYLVLKPHPWASIKNGTQHLELIESKSIGFAPIYDSFEELRKDFPDDDYLVVKRSPQPTTSPKCVCPVCGSEEMEHDGPNTVYACGSSDYDQRPDTFYQSKMCKVKPLRHADN